MSETIIEAVSVSEIESQVAGLDNSDNEAAVGITEFPRLDGEVMPLVVANAEVTAPCRWMGGAEVTLTIALINYPKKMTEEIADEIIADIYEFLAGRVEETEEAEEEGAAEEELEKSEKKSKKDEPAKGKRTGDKNEANAQKELKNIKKGDTGKQPKVGSDAKQPGLPISQIKKIISPKAGTQTKTETAEAANSAKGRPPETAASKAEAGTVFLGKPENIPMASESTIIGEMDIKDRPESPTLELAVNKVAEVTRLAAPVHEPAEFYVAETPNDDINSTLELIEDEPKADTFEYQASPDNFDEFIESEEVIISHFEAGVEPDDILASGYLAIESTEDYFEPPVYGPERFDVLEQAQDKGAEQVVQAAVVIEDVEDSLSRLADQLEAAAPETAEAADEILDKIIEVPAKLEAASFDETVTQERAQEELEELFTELFDIIQIDYTPELVESLAQLSLQWRLIDKIEELKTKEEKDDEPQGYGTHEIIRKLLAGLSTIKRAISQAGAIGKSALRLYIFSFAA